MRNPWQEPRTPRPGKPHFRSTRANDIVHMTLELEDGLKSFCATTSVRGATHYGQMRGTWNLAVREGYINGEDK